MVEMIVHVARVGLGQRGDMSDGHMKGLWISGPT